MSNIYDLKHDIMERKFKKNKIYDKIYDKIINKIIYTNSNTTNCYCVYKFINFYFGIPKYNIIECISYVNEKLRQNKYKVGILNNNTIIISWLHILDNNTNNEKQIDKNISLIELKEKEELKHNNQFNKLQKYDNKYIQSKSHYGNILLNYPCYDNLSICNNNNMIDYTEPIYNNNKNNNMTNNINPNNSRYISNNKNYNDNNNIYMDNINMQNNHKEKQQQLKSSNELDNLLDQFDSSSLL